MANKKIFLGMLVLAVVFGMSVAGCGDSDYTPVRYDNQATLVVNNTSSIDYYYSYQRSGSGGLMGMAKVAPGSSTYFVTKWNDGESSSLTIYYSSDRTTTNPQSRTYYGFSKNERRSVNLP
jgi:uncharacterized lipoprotein YehR (DUF1307 family)